MLHFLIFFGSLLFLTSCKHQQATSKIQEASSGCVYSGSDKYYLFQEPGLQTRAEFFLDPHDAVTVLDAQGEAFHVHWQNNVQGWAHKNLFSGSCEITARPPPIVAGSGRRAFDKLIAWAYTPELSYSAADINSDLAKIQSYGANAIYIAHSNPGYIEDAEPTEIGLTFSVWYTAKKHGVSTDASNRAHAIINQIHQALGAAQNLNLKVLLAVGYQIQMSKHWNEQNPGALRLNRDGSTMNHWGSGITASPYHSAFQNSIREYYEWVNAEFVQRYPNIVALNLADEPMGSDFSSAAVQTFQDRTGCNLHNPSEGDCKIKAGQFLSGVIADYATITANIWKQINNSVWTMMTFHFQRDLFWFPSMEQVFAKTPDNFIVSTDSHYHDAPHDSDVLHLGLLHNLVANMSLLSRHYNKKIMYWSSVNNWGLRRDGNQDWAFENIDIITAKSSPYGGLFSMLMFWGYNIRHQGSYRDLSWEANLSVDKGALISGLKSQKNAQITAALTNRGQTLPQKIWVLKKTDLDYRLGSILPDHLTGHFFDWGSVQGALKDNNHVILVEGAATQSYCGQLGAVCEDLPLTR